MNPNASVILDRKIVPKEGSPFLMRRRKMFSGWAVAVLAVLLVSGPRSAVAETIRISGTGGAMGTMRILGEAFQKTNPGIRVEILPVMGSSGSVRAILARHLDIGLSARTLSAEERARGIVETKYARTPFVFCVNSTLKITGLTLEGVAEIYGGKRDWENGKRIRLVLRLPQDSDIPVLKGMSPSMSAAVDVALRRNAMIVAMTDHEVADAIETVPGAFGGTTLSLLLSEKRALRILSVDGITPSVRTMAARTYPYSKTFFMVTRNNPSASVRRFIDFVRSPAGAAILAKNGQEAMRQGEVLP
jgi:phosphate transport system substrate-binding protein